MLVADRGFQRAMKAYAGKARTNFRGEDAKEPLWDEMKEVLYGPPDPPAILSDGSYLFTACMAHYCIDKGAVVISPKGEIIAAAMFTGKPVDAEQMFSPYTLQLNIFVKNERAHWPWRKRLDDWANRAAAEWRSLPDTKLYSANIDTRIWLISPSTAKLKRLDLSPREY
ncbi:MAG: hypothetical protein H0W65_09335 [Sphingomonas sp.]|uniref:hypothetical protein n=1 Tax=Sphingomonas sp. TaxID=28214 RepID=UPI0017B8C814|nr:hypothetical protein [Sphingomonas sp.]MBA3667911.1 hypothetical protein [Sphingomonas sp.]